MGMRVTDNGIDWDRLADTDFDKVARQVTESARTSTVTIAGMGPTRDIVSCPCGRDQQRSAHYVDMAGREVCPTAGLFALRAIESSWNNPLVNALSKPRSL